MLATAAVALLGTAAQAQTWPVTAAQRSTAEQVAQAGVALSELAPDAPDQYTVKGGDTLWGISGVFLKSPWRWPELWGMNMEEVHNPHLIYPGQVLMLEKTDGRARLHVGTQVGDSGSGDGSGGTVRLSPRTRVEPLTDGSLPTLKSHLIEPFLTEGLIVDEAILNRAPRVVAVPENKVLITRGDRAYARGPAAAPLMPAVAGREDPYRLFRSAKALKHPVTQKVLGWEAQYVGKASLVRGESSQPRTWFGGSSNAVQPATIDIVAAKEEIRVGDRMLPEPPRQFTSYAPHAPAGAMTATIVSVYGDAVSIAGQNQVVVIDKGLADGVDNGTVMAILKSGQAMMDRTQRGEHAHMQLPDERNGLLMVFRPFERLSYALILEINDAVQIGDRVTNPR